MNKFFLGLALFLGAVLILTFGAQSGPLPPYPFSKPSRQMDLEELKHKAVKLFEYSRKVNPRLAWDPCLAQKAYMRAKQLVKDDYFDHKDPITGKNPAWNLVVECHSCKYAGENLAKGSEPAEAIHRAWMNSATHKKNIVDPRFSMLGVGCYNEICVELFAGF